MKKISSVLATSLILAITGFSPITAQAIDAETLHNASCTECHSRMTGGDGSLLYTREKRLVNNQTELLALVNRCATLSVEGGWSDAEIKAVSHYLDEQFYLFSK